MIENKSLAEFTTFGIGGPARYFVAAETENEIVEATNWAAKNDIPLFVLGGGSNLLVSDRGFNGLVLKIGILGVKVIAKEANRTIYSAGAGENWDQFVQATVKDNCAGLECLAGIPGTVGGTPVQNVGAYGQEVSTSIAQVRAYDLQVGSFVEFSADECGFAYRHSRFNSTDRGRYIVTRVQYRLFCDGAPTISYADLHKAIEELYPTGRHMSLADVANVVRRVRQSKGMLLTAGDPDSRSAGSFFKNPVIGDEHLQRIVDTCGKWPLRFSAGLGRAKVPAAWLIERAGFPKGYALGNAALSSKHTLALINRGGASSRDVLALAEEIRSTVETQFGIRLEMEPVMVGF